MAHSRQPLLARVEIMIFIADLCKNARLSTSCGGQDRKKPVNRMMAVVVMSYARGVGKLHECILKPLKKLGNYADMAINVKCVVPFVPERTATLQISICIVCYMHQPYLIST